MIIINFANFPKFIDAIGGVNVKTGRICSEISGGAQNGGWTLNLQPGNHHLNGIAGAHPRPHPGEPLRCRQHRPDRARATSSRS